MSNCLVFALRRFWQRGGYVVMVWSDYGWWPHFVWSPDLQQFEEWSPARKARKWFPPLVFRGAVKAWRP
jgi:hypothetical protein